MEHQPKPDQEGENDGSLHRKMLIRRARELIETYKISGGEQKDIDYRTHQLEGLVERIQKNEEGEFDAGKFGSHFLEADLAEALGFPLEDQ